VGGRDKPGHDAELGARVPYGVRTAEFTPAPAAWVPGPTNLILRCTLEPPTALSRPLAFAAMLAAVIIYGSNFALSRHAALNGFTSEDLTALRFGVAGLLLLPFFLRQGASSCAGVGWGRGLLLFATCGVPMVLLMFAGLSLAPAGHGAAIQPGTVTVIGAVGSILMFGTRPGPAVVAGIAIVLAGLAALGIAAGTTGSPQVLLGDLCFLVAGAVWGFYPLLLQRWSVGPLASTAIVAVLSLSYLPIYAVQRGAALIQHDVLVVLGHAFNQGVLNVIVGLWLWGYAVRVLGAATAQRFPPLIPVVGTLAAIPIVGEWPSPLQAWGVALIVGGLLFANLGGSIRWPARPRAALTGG
jgi:drug/metabolite transporter (DMT)-like permease